jgi:rhodanese-related sulfurtransferase
MIHAPMISARQLMRRMLQPSSASLDSSGSTGKKLLVIDVRDDDFDGGNIIGAVNIPSHTFPNQVAELIARTCDGNHELVFHCMMSQVRGPRCCRLFLAELYDKVENVDLHPEVYILEGGFAGFVNAVPESQKNKLLERMQ